MFSGIDFSFSNTFITGKSILAEDNSDKFVGDDNHFVDSKNKSFFCFEKNEKSIRSEPKW